MPKKNYFKQKLEDTKTALVHARDSLNAVSNSLNNPDRMEAIGEYRKTVRRKKEYEERIDRLRLKKRQDEAELKQLEEKENREENQDRDGKDSKSPKKKESFGKRLKNRVKKAGRAVGKGIYRTGKAVSAVGKGVKVAGKALVMTAKVIRAAAKAVKATAKAVRMAAQTAIQAGSTLISAGVSLCGTVVGAIAGVPMIAAGAVMVAAGAVVYASSLALDAVGMAMSGVAKVTELAGKGLQKVGNVIDRVGKQISKVGNNIYKQFNNGKSIPGAERANSNGKTLSLSNSKGDSKDNSNSMAPVIAEIALASEQQAKHRDDNKKDSPVAGLANGGRNDDGGRGAPAPDNESRQETAQPTAEEYAQPVNTVEDNVMAVPAQSPAPQVSASFSPDEKTESLEKVHTLASKTGRTSLASRSSRQLRSHITKTQGKQSFNAYRKANRDKHPEWRPRVRHAPTTISPAMAQLGRSSGGLGA